MFGLIVALAIQVYAADPVTSAIEAAQGLTLKKNRKEACAVLNRAIASAPTQTRNRSKLAATLRQLSRVFFTDKGQKLQESAQVLMFENPDLALSQLREARALEDDNVVVLSNLGRAQMMKQDCDGALASLASARVLDPISVEPALLELRALLCAQRFDAFKDKFRALNLASADKWDQAFGQYLFALEQMRLNLPKKAHDILAKITEDFGQFPEPYYYLAKSAEALEKDPSPWLRKYSGLCKGLTLRDRKKYSYEPQLCGKAKEVDDELASTKHEN